MTWDNPRSSELWDGGKPTHLQLRLWIEILPQHIFGRVLVVGIITCQGCLHPITLENRDTPPGGIMDYAFTYPHLHFTRIG